MKQQDTIDLRTSRERSVPQRRELQKKRGVPHILLILCIAAAAFWAGRAGVNAEKLQNGIRTALDFDLSGEDAIGRLKFVKKEAVEAVAAFAQQISEADNVKLPGTVAEAFDEKTHPYVLLNCSGESGVVSPALGRVTDVSEGVRGKTVQILTEDDAELFYQGFREVSVSAGETVERGDILGTAEEFLYLYETKDGASADASLLYEP